MILELLSGSPAGLSLADISTALAIPKTITHRLLALLIDTGYVRQDPRSPDYALTLKLTVLGDRYFVGTGLKDFSQPVLDRLAEATGEFVRLALVEGDGLIWAAKAQGARHGLRYDPEAGNEVVLHATATGKAWLATLEKHEAIRIITAKEFKTPDSFGQNTIRTVEDFLLALEETRRNGYGVAVDEGESGTAAVAAAIHASTAKDAPAVGTVSVAGPMSRFSPVRREEFGNLLKAAAAELSAHWTSVRRPTLT